MSIRRIQDRVLYLPGTTSAGVVVATEGKAILIDTGLGDRSGRALLRALREHDLTPTAILNTHGHGDHTGGNAYIVERTGARVYAPAMDAVVMEQPAWGTACLLAGAEPLPALVVPRYTPRPCAVDAHVEPGAFHVAGVEIKAIALPGHTGSHTGYLVDGVLFLGDAVAGPAEINAAPISYAYSVTLQLDTLLQLQNAAYSAYVLGHGGLVQDIRDLVARNLQRIEGLLAFVRETLENGPLQSGDMMSIICQFHDLPPRHIRDYYLLYATLHAYLGHLSRTGEIDFLLQDGRLFWRLIP